MFTPSKRLQELQEIAGMTQKLVREHLIEDFVAHLEEEYRFGTAQIEKSERPSILAWLGRVGGYYAMIQDRGNTTEQLDIVRTTVRAVLDWDEFATQLDGTLNKKYGQGTAERLTVKSAAKCEAGFFLRMEVLTFRYHPRNAWSD